MLELNFSNMMEDTIGDNGISPAEIDALKSEVERVHNSLIKRTLSELAFIDLPYFDTSGIKKIAEWIRSDTEDFLLLGIGGSALGPKTILEALSPLHNYRKKPRVFICDNVDPRTVSPILSIINKKKTTVNVITKSGSTAETMALFMVLFNEIYDIKNRLIATTDPEKGNLRAIARSMGLKTLSIPPGVVGRYSVLSPVGLLLAEVIGVDSEDLLKGARDINEKCHNLDVWKNPAYMFGALLYLMYKKGKNINVLMPYLDGLKPLSEWFCQIWAESLGKDGYGITPYPSLGTIDQHSQLQLWMDGPEDKVVIFVRIEDYEVDIKIPEIFKDIEGIGYLAGHFLSELMKSEEESTELALSKKKRPNMTISMPSLDPYHLGQIFQFFEIATAFTGLLCNINPFNQPGVEEGKNFTYGMLGKKGFEDRRREVEKARERKNLYRI